MEVVVKRNATVINGKRSHTITSTIKFYRHNQKHCPQISMHISLKGTNFFKHKNYSHVDLRVCCVHRTIHIPNVRDVISVLKLRYTTRHHHSEQVEKESSTLSQLQEGIFTQLLEPVQS